MTTRRRLSDEFKDSAAPETLPGDKTVLELAARHTIHPTQITNWKRQAIDGLTGVVFEKEKRAGDIGMLNTASLPRSEVPLSHVAFTVEAGLPTTGGNR